MRVRSVVLAVLAFAVGALYRAVPRQYAAAVGAAAQRSKRSLLGRQ